MDKKPTAKKGKARQGSYHKKPEPRPVKEAHAAEAKTGGFEDVLEGRNAVIEALKTGREIDKVFVAEGAMASLGHIIARAREAGIVVQQCDRRKLDKISQTGAHQGIIAMAAAADYKSIDDMLALAKSRREAPLIILCDGLTDSHNLGAIIRSAEVAGAHGVIIPKRRSAGLNGACAKAAAGALEHLPVAKCSGVAQAIVELKKKGLFIFAADAGGQSMYEVDFKCPAAIVIGSEGDGISQSVRKESDFTVGIPQRGMIPSLNASNAAAVLLYEALRQRSGQ